MLERIHGAVIRHKLADIFQDVFEQDRLLIKGTPVSDVNAQRKVNDLKKTFSTPRVPFLNRSI